MCDFYLFKEHPTSYFAQKGTNFSFISALFCRPLAEMNDTKATNSTVDGEVNYKEDLFCWTIEGVGILVIGLIGVFGNSCSMVLFSRQKVHRIFHHLLLLLSFFDLVSTKKIIYCIYSFHLIAWGAGSKGWAESAPLGWNRVN